MSRDGSCSTNAVPDLDSYVYAGAPNGSCVYRHGILDANFWKATARRRAHYKETDCHNESCYRADAEGINRHGSNGAEFSKQPTNAAQQIGC